MSSQVAIVMRLSPSLVRQSQQVSLVFARQVPLQHSQGTRIVVGGSAAFKSVSPGHPGWYIPPEIPPSRNLTRKGPNNRIF